MQMLFYRWIMAAFLAVMAISLTACSNHDMERNKMLKYMEEKYGEKFTAVEAYGGQIGKDYSMLKVSGQFADNALVRVIHESGKDIYQDNYLGFIHKQEIQEKTHPIAEEIFGTCKVFYRVPSLVFPPTMTADTKAEKLLKNPQAMTRFFIYPKHRCKNSLKKLEDFRLRLGAEGYCIGGVISFPLNAAWYQEISEENFGGESYLGYEAYEEVSFRIDETGEFKYLKWIKNGEEQ